MLFGVIASRRFEQRVKIEDDAVSPSMIVGLNESEDESEANNANKPDEILAKAIELLKTRQSALPATTAPVKN